MKRGRADAALVLLALSGIAIDALLLSWKLNADGIAGCGGGSGCGEVLASRWSAVLGVPVALLGIAVYVLILASWFTRKTMIFNAGLAMLAGSVLWFAFLQAKVIGQICPWCLASHAIAAATMMTGFILCHGPPSSLRRGAMMGSSAVALLIAAQVLGPVPASHRIEESTGSVGVPAGDVHARGDGRKIVFDEGAKIYDTQALPRLGPADAKHVLVEYFDYQCPACRTMRGHLAALRAKHPRDVAVIVLPVPLERGCNRMLGPKDTVHPGSCELSKIALAVWRAEPAAFEEIHQAFLSGITAGEAMNVARSKVSPERLDLALKEPWIDEILKLDTEDWIVFSTSSRHLPKLLITGRRILHGLPSGEEEFIRVMERELGL